MKKVLITGIEGFVGTHLAEYLHKKKYKIFGIYYAKPVKRIGKLYRCDIRDYPKLFQVIKEIKPEVIFHLAAQSSVSQGEKNILDTFSINTQGTLNIFESVRQAELKPRIIYISSCEVYGQSNGKLSEKSETKPKSFYATSKLCAESICQYYVVHYGMDIVILRPFSHTGPRQGEQFIFPRIAKRIAEIEAGHAKNTLVVGNTNVRRDYTDIADIIKAYHLALLKCRVGQVYNITSGRAYSIQSGIEYLIKLSKMNIKVKTDKKLMRSNDISLLTGSAKKFMRATGWKPEIDFFTTLTNLLYYYRETTRK